MSEYFTPPEFPELVIGSIVSVHGCYSDPHSELHGDHFYTGGTVVLMNEKEFVLDTEQGFVIVAVEDLIAVWKS